MPNINCYNLLIFMVWVFLYHIKCRSIGQFVLIFLANTHGPVELTKLVWEFNALKQRFSKNYLMVEQVPTTCKVRIFTKII